MNKKYLTYILVLATLGFIISLLLAKVGINVVNDPQFKSFCNFNTAFDCDAVALSSYASHFGIPNFLYGIGYYLVIIIFSSYILYRNENFLPNMLVYVFWLSLLSLIFSFYLFMVSHLLIKSFCLLCMLIYLVNVIMFVVAFMSEKWSIIVLFKKLIDDIRLYFHSGWRTFIFILLLFNVVGMLYYFNDHPILLNRAQAKENNTAIESEKYNIDYSASTQGRLVLGTTAKPAVTIIEFTDYECSHCAHASSEILKLLKTNPDVRLIIKDYPLDQSCNQRINKPFHQFSCKAALYARCSAEQGKYWEYHDLLFNNQGSFDNTTLNGFAEQVKLDINKFKECVNSQKYMDSIITDIDEGAALGIDGTPTFYIEGRKVEGLRDVAELQKIIDEIKLEKQKKQEEREKFIEQLENRKENSAPTKAQ